MCVVLQDIGISVQGGWGVGAVISLCICSIDNPGVGVRQSVLQALLMFSALLLVAGFALLMNGVVLSASSVHSSIPSNMH